MKLSLLVALAALFLAAPAPAQAQTTSGWWDWAAGSFLPERSSRVDDRRADRRVADRWDRDDDRRGNDRGPKFCQNGQGHPVHGMRWCYEKGFGRDRYTSRRPGWERRTIGNIVFGRPQRTDRVRILDRRDLEDLLGRRTVQRLAGETERGGTLAGRWVQPHGSARVLQIRAGRQPLAELSDLDGDGRVDLALVYRAR